MKTGRDLRLFAAMCCMLGAETAFAANTCTTCYVDYNNGSDANDGTAKTTGGGHGPWKHAPGMLGLSPSGSSTGDGCASNCASQVPKAGDQYILKGGEIWPYTTLPWLWTWSGTSTTSGSYGCAGTGCIYIGYDPTWNLGIVNAVTLQRDLGGCTGTPSVAFSGGGGSSAAATANVMASGVSGVEPNVAGFVTSVTITSQGSGYTSNPSVTITGGSCTGITAVADINRPVIDAGLNSSIEWPVGYGSGNLQNGPGLTLYGGYVIVDHLEIRNILQNARACGSACGSNPDGIITAFVYENGPTGHTTISNNYIHGRQTTCYTTACENQEQADRGILLGTSSDEATGNYVTNGDQIVIGNGSTTYAGNNVPFQFGENSIYGSVGGTVHGNYIYGVRWLIHEGDNGCNSSTTILMYNNEAWLVLYDAGTAHVNEFYTLMTCSTLYEYNNVVHSSVSGGSNQQQMGNGTTQYFFNNVSWNLGGGTPNYGIDTQNGAGSGGGHFYFYNNTMYSNSGTNVCINAGGSSAYVSDLTVTLQNNHCITNQSPYWGVYSTETWQDYAGSTTQANVEAASTVMSASTATSQGYAVANLFAPTSTSTTTYTFAAGGTSANLTSLCSGNLTALCSDINGNPRPATGGWQAGAYVLGASQVLVAPPIGLTITVQ